MPYYPGKAILLSNYSGPTTSPTGGYRNLAGALYDPTTVTLKYRLPGAAVTSVTTPTLVKDAVGLYHLVVIPASDGVIVGAWLSSDGAYQPFTVDVQPPPI